SPADAPSDHGESREVALRLGDAVRMASTPASNVMAVTAPESATSVETIITASPFCRSASVLLGKRLSMRCKSGGPLPLGPPPGPRPACDSVDGDGRAPPAPGATPCPAALCPWPCPSAPG